VFIQLPLVVVVLEATLLLHLAVALPVQMEPLPFFQQ
jgi:hypothetical protein